MKKKILILAFIIVIVGIIIIYSFMNQNQSNNKENDTVNISHIDLLEKLNKYKNYSIDVINVNNNLIYGTIESEEKNNIIFSTVAIFWYNILNDEITIISQPNDKRIMDFSIINNQIYYCYLSVQENNKFKCEITITNIDTNESKNIISYTIDEAFDYPRFFAKDGDKLYLMAKIDDKARILSIKDAEIDNIKTIESNSINQYNMDSITLNNNKIYYTYTDEDGFDAIKCIDLNKNEEKMIYKSINYSYVIYTFNIVENKIIIQEAIEENKSNLITLNLELEKVENIIETNLLTFPEVINNNSILFHISDASWKKYCINENIFKTIKLPGINNKNIFPKYFLIDTNLILLQDFDNEFYIVDFP